ncbi:MAG: hydrolase [Candidatus Sericytochromatia bacterium]|nr:MAG: hydrolase [Candidatus Sericytochromatia bacterium]
MRIKSEDSLLLIIDIQEKLFPHISNNKILLENVIKLIKGIKILKLPILITEQYTKGLGFTLDEIKQELDLEYKPFEKMAFSCCKEDIFFQKLKDLNKKNIVICGIETHVCVLQTCIDLLENGFNPIIVEDCVSSRKENDKKIAINRMNNEGSLITTYESILLELCVKSGTDIFKSISKIIK